MKHVKPVAVVLAILAVGLFTGGCSEARRLSPAEFVDKAHTPVGDVHDVDFIGVRQGRAYLREWRYWPVIGERTRLLWTEASGLSPEELQELEAERIREELAARKSREVQAGPATTMSVTDVPGGPP